MRKSLIIKSSLFLLIFSFMMFYSPHLLVSEIKNRGNLIGFIYGADGTTPLERGIIKIRNISTGTVYESTKSDMLGIFMIEGIERGLYIATISTREGNFKVRNFIGIKTSETAKVSFALEVMGGHEEEMRPVGAATVIASSDPIMYNSVALSEDPPGDAPGDDQGDDPGDAPGDPPGDDDTVAEEEEADREAQEEKDEADREAQEEADEAEAEEDEDEDEDDPSPCKPGT